LTISYVNGDLSGIILKGNSLSGGTFAGKNLGVAAIGLLGYGWRRKRICV
jgi:hypothetical protein